MPVTKYQITISTGTANGKVNIDQFTYDVDHDADIVVLVDYMNSNVEPNKLDVYMVDALTAPQEAALRAAALVHQGFGISSKMQGTVPIVSGEKAIISDLPWEIIEGVVTTPSFFDPDMTKILARIIGEHKGDGGQLSVTENVLGGVPEEEHKINPYFDFPDTAGTWQRFKVDSNIPPRNAVRNIYRTCARLNGDASLNLRFMTISMIVVRVV